MGESTIHSQMHLESINNEKTTTDPRHALYHSLCGEKGGGAFNNKKKETSLRKDEGGSIYLTSKGKPIYTYVSFFKQITEIPKITNLQFSHILTHF